MKCCVLEFGAGAVLLSALSLLVGCSTPEEEHVRREFREIFVAHNEHPELRPVVLSVAPAEGDSSAVYERIRFDVVAEAGLDVRSGWFEGRRLGKGDRLKGGEMEIVFLKQKDGDWQRYSYKLLKAPE